jgi:hypothetical protein
MLPRRARRGDGTCDGELNDLDESYVTMVGTGWALSNGDCRPVEPPKIQISGRLVDADDRPVAQTQIRLWSPDSRKGALTDEAGAFRLTTDVERSTYDVDAILETHAAEAIGRRRVHLGTLKAGDHDVVLRAPMTQPVRKVLAEGVVVDEDGAPLADRHVTASAVTTNGIVASADSDAEGRFRIMSWTTPKVALAVETHESSPRRIESQTVDSATGLVRIVMSNPGLIAGRVVAEHGGDVRGAVVRLRRVDDDAERTAVVDASGEFAFKGLDVKATYKVRAECAGYIEEPHEGECSVDQFDVRLFLTKSDGVLAGRVVDSASSPLRAAWLRFVPVDAGVGFQLMTDDDGGFKTYEARDVDYDVHVLAPGADGRLVPGESIARCRGGATSLIFRAPR